MRETLSSKKALIITLGVGLMLIGALLVYGILVTPARQPYRDALTQYENTNTALSRTSISVNASAASEEEFKKGIEAVRASLQSLEVENEALGKEAVLSTGKGKELYDAYNKDVQRYVTYNSDVVASMEKIRPVLMKCALKSDATTITPGDAERMSVCAEDMRTLGDIPNEDYAALAGSLEEIYAALADIFGRMVAGPETTGNQSSQALLNEWNQQNEAYSEASTTFSKNVQAERKEILSTRSATDLKVYLEDESRIF